MTWRSENSCPHRDSNSDLLVVQPVASLYTDFAIPAILSSKYRDIFLRVKRPGRETDDAPPLESRSIVELQIHSPTRFHGVVLK
jgi:hypothetical protein